MKIVPIPNGTFAENSYLVIDEQAGECAIVDPGEEAGLILHKVRASGTKPVAIWLTHAHIDHVIGVRTVATETGAAVWLHPADRPLYDAVPEQAAWFGLAMPGRLPAPDHDMVPGAALTVGTLRFTVRHAPGHSPGSVCLIGPGAVFTGDVLFAGSIGRTDLPGGDFDTLIASIERELLPLSDDTIVYSGHGPETTIGRERRGNPFLTGAPPVRPIQTR
ncbi:MAG TPA: MBL fold metallo-hydrolase [Gemmatimonadales bacterium]|nr:MBL fold metallo-hydrolase [Gemmatimonadales bacterium]